MKTISAGQATNNGYDGADFYLVYHGALPDYYITAEEARALGWRAALGNLFLAAPGKMLDNGTFQNRGGKLPSAPGRIWYEVDINYTIGYRNGHRIVYSNDGLVFVTYDHYQTFQEIV